MKRPCAFLDRDGVLNHDGDGYIYRPEALVWMPEAREAVRRLNEAGYLVVVVSNQSGVARGYFTEDDVRAFHDHMNRELGQAGAHVDAFYFCPFHEDAVTDRYRADNHPDRKPNPGMILKAMSALEVRREESFLIGDKLSDLGAAFAADIPAFHYTGGSLLTLVEAILANHASLRDRQPPRAT